MGKTIKTVLIIAAAVALVVFAAPVAGFAVTAGLGAIGVTTAALTASLVTLGIGLALSAATSFFMKSPKVSNSLTDRLRFNPDPTSPRKIVFGRTAAGSDVRFHESYGKDKDTLSMVLALASHKITRVKQVWLNTELSYSEGQTAAQISKSDIGAIWKGKYVVPQAGVLGKYAKGIVELSHCLEGTTTNGRAVGTGQFWKSTSTFTGCSYSVLTFKADAKIFPEGLPQRITTIIDGCPVYDPRLDSTRGGSGSHRAEDQSTWSYDNGSVEIGRNPALAILTYIIGWKINDKLAWGWGQSLNKINYASFIEYANLSEERVTTKDGGTTQRYTCDSIFSTLDSHETVTATIAMSMGATKLVDVGGEYSLIGGHDDTLITPFAFTNDHIVGDTATYVPSPPARERFNILKGRFANPDDLYSLADWGSVEIDPLEDQIPRVNTMDFPTQVRSDSCQRIAKQMVLRDKYSGMFSGMFGPEAFAVQVGSLCTLSLSRFGFNAKLFRVVEQAEIHELLFQMTLREESPEIYAWDANEAKDIPKNIMDQDYDPIVASPVVGLSSVARTVAGASGVTTTYIDVTWQSVGTSARVNAIEIQARRAGEDRWTAQAEAYPDIGNFTFNFDGSGIGCDIRARYIMSNAIRGDWSSANLTSTPITNVNDFGAVYGSGRPADNATNSADPASPFGPNGGTVGSTLATLSTAGQAAASDRAIAEAKAQVATEKAAAATLANTDAQAARTAAQTAATNTLTSANTATTAATNATSAKTAAETARTAAQSYAENTLADRNAAAVSATTAGEKATAAGNSANAANSSAVVARSSAALTLPRGFEQGEIVFTTIETVPTITYPVVDGVRRMQVVTDASTKRGHIQHVGSLPALAGRKLRSVVKLAQLNNIGDASTYAESRFVAYPSGRVLYNNTPRMLWTTASELKTLVNDFTVSVDGSYRCELLTWGIGGTIWQIVSFSLEDVTDVTASQTAATAAAVSSSSAATSASGAGLSATSASASEVSAKLSGAMVAPSEFSQEGKFFSINKPLGTLTYPTDTAAGKVAQLEDGRIYIAPLLGMKGTGSLRRYRATCRLRTLAKDQTAQANLGYYASPEVTPSNPTAGSGAGGTPPTGSMQAKILTVADGWVTFISEVDYAGTDYIRPTIYAPSVSGSQVQIQILRFEDVTDSKAAAQSAAAAVSSASAADVSKTAAGTSATAAQTARTGAETASGQAATYRTEASSSATLAAGSASTASTQAGISATQAGNSAASAAQSLASAATASDKAAAASSSAILASSIGGGALNANPVFSNWTSVYPANYGQWESPTIAKLPGLLSPFALNIYAPAGQNAGVVAADANAPFAIRRSEWVVIEADIKLDGGTLASAGMLVRGVDTGDIMLSFAVDKDTRDLILGAGIAGEYYKFRKLVQAPAGSNQSSQIYLMNHWNGFGSTAAANQITWYRAAVRPATSAEIAAQRADIVSAAALARITTEEATRASETAAAAARSNTIEASLNTANGRITSVESTSVDRDNALSNRAATLEAQFAGTTDSPMLARIRNEETSRATGDVALTNRIAVQEARAGAGGNLLANTDFALGAEGWTGANEQDCVYSRDMAGDSWRPVPDHNIGIQQVGSAARSPHWYSNQFAVEANSWYECSAYLASHRAKCQVYIQVSDKDDNLIGNFAVSGEVYGGPGSNSINGYIRYWGKQQLPANASRARFIFQKYTTESGADSYAWMARPFAAKCSATQTGPSAFSHGVAIGALVTNARIAEEATTRAAADSAIATRTSTLESRVGGHNSGDIVGRLANEETTRATQTSAAATRSQNLETRAGNLEASVNQQAGALVDVKNKVSTAWLENTVAAGAGYAAVKLRAEGVSNTSQVNLIAGTISLDNQINGQTVQALKVENGNAVFSGRLQVNGGVISSPDGSARFDLSGARIVFNQNGYMKVTGSGFGSQGQFIDWFGPSFTDPAQCTESTAISYLKTNGDAYFGGRVLENQLRNQKSTNSTADNQVAVGPFASNGRARTYTATIFCERTGFRYSNYDDTGVFAANFTIERLDNGNWVELVGGGSMSYIYSNSLGTDGQGYASESEPGNFYQSGSGSISYVDSTGGIGPFTVRARLHSLSLPGVTGKAYAQDKTDYYLRINTYEA